MLDPQFQVGDLVYTKFDVDQKEPGIIIDRFAIAPQDT